LEGLSCLLQTGDVDRAPYGFAVIVKNGMAASKVFIYRGGMILSNEL